MKKNKKIPSYSQILSQVPIDYYDKGIRSNYFQYLWHVHKYYIFKQITNTKKFKKILDIGCASGIMTNYISSIFPKSKITALDAYQKAVKFAQKKYPHIKFVKGDAHKLSFNKNLYDLVVCYETIEHLKNPIKALSEIKRVLKPRGLAVVAMDSGNFLFRIVWWIWENSKGKVWRGSHIHPYHHAELEQKIKDVGFRIKQKKFTHLGMEVVFVLSKL